MGDEYEAELASRLMELSRACESSPVVKKDKPEKKVANIPTVTKIITTRPEKKKKIVDVLGWAEDSIRREDIEKKLQAPSDDVTIRIVKRGNYTREIYRTNCIMYYQRWMYPFLRGYEGGRENELMSVLKCKVTGEAAVGVEWQLVVMGIRNIRILKKNLALSLEASPALPDGVPAKTPEQTPQQPWAIKLATDWIPCEADENGNFCLKFNQKPILDLVLTNEIFGRRECSIVFKDTTGATTTIYFNTQFKRMKKRARTPATNGEQGKRQRSTPATKAKDLLIQQQKKEIAGLKQDLLFFKNLSAKQSLLLPEAKRVLLPMIPPSMQALATATSGGPNQSLLFTNANSAGSIHSALPGGSVAPAAGLFPLGTNQNLLPRSLAPVLAPGLAPALAAIMASTPGASSLLAGTAAAQPVRTAPPAAVRTLSATPSVLPANPTAPPKNPPAAVAAPPDSATSAVDVACAAAAAAAKATSVPKAAAAGSLDTFGL